MVKVFGKENQALHDRSGQVVLPFNPLVGFLYEAMRNGDLSAGKAEELVRHNTDIGIGRATTVTYCNGWLAKYAEDLANRLVNETCWPIPKPEEIVSNEEYDRHQCGT